MKTCPVCETENELGAKHCEVCGEPLPIPQGDDVPGNPTQIEARDTIEAVVPGTADNLAAKIVAESPIPGGLGQDDAAALAQFDAMLAADSDAQPPVPALDVSPIPLDTMETPSLSSSADIREARDTIVELPAVTRNPPPEIEATAHLVVYVNREAAHTHDVVNDETLIGRADPASDSYPDLDLTTFDPNAEISRKHAYLLREGGKYYVRPLSNGGTQLNKHLLDIGQKTEIENGDVLILAGVMALKFNID